MGIPLQITKHTVVVSSATDAQPLDQAVEIIGIDIMDLVMTVAFESTGGSLGVGIYSGMQRLSTDGWVSCGSFYFVGSVLPVRPQLLTITKGLLRYARWQVTSSPGVAVHMSIEGVGRRYGRG
jgi:hypothetical protein